MGTDGGLSGRQIGRDKKRACQNGQEIDAMVGWGCGVLVFRYRMRKGQGSYLCQALSVIALKKEKRKN